MRLPFRPITALGSANQPVSPARRIAERFLAPCCWRENLAVHLSPEAEAMRVELRQLAASGKSEDEIVAFYVARYGGRILREPLGAPAIWLRVMPVAATAIGLGLVTFYIARAQRRKPQVTSASGPVPED